MSARIQQLEDEISDHMKEGDRQHGIIMRLTDHLSEKELLLIDKLLPLPVSDIGWRGQTHALRVTMQNASKRISGNLLEAVLILCQ